MTTDPSLTELRALSEVELVSEAMARFGIDARGWAFQCPACGDIAQVAEFPNGGRQAGQYCIGNFVDGRGCDYKAFGLLPGPWTVTMKSGSPVSSFPLAPANAPAGFVDLAPGRTAAGDDAPPGHPERLGPA